MRVKDTLRMVAGSVGIYVVVAACGSHGDNVILGDGGQKDGKAGVRDALTDPVGEASADENQSGSRLKAQRFVGSDMSSQFIGFYDSMLKSNCAFSNASDGKTRCLPSGASVAVVTTGYSDSGCTSPVGAIAQACSAPKYAVEAVGNGGCPNASEVQVYNVGAEVTGMVYAKVGTKCDALTSGQTSAYHFYSLGATVPASDFIEATVQMD